MTPRFPERKIGRHRWTILRVLIFAATTINYLDRNVLAYLTEFVLTAGGGVGDENRAERIMHFVVICFQVAYALGLTAFVGKRDRQGGHKVEVTLGRSSAGAWRRWANAFGHYTWSFGFWRATLGVTEAGNFPAANKAIAEWFPKRERAFATGCYNSGANVGAIRRTA
jgi:ACS family hexuronate transporter-like MFS transporter